MEDDKQNYDLMGNFVKCLHDTYDKNKIKKYIIAHQTVQKVPYIPFSDLEPVTSENVQTLEKLLLEYAMLKNNSNECAIVYRMDSENFSSNLERISIVEGNIDTVHVGNNPLIEDARDVVVVTMHNHPNNSPLSIVDLAFFMSTRCVKLLTAVGNNGTVEAIQKKNAFDLSSAGPYFTSLLTSVGGILEDKLRTLTREDIKALDPNIKNKITRDWIEYQAVNQSIEYKYAEAKQNEKHNQYQKTRCDMAEKLDGNGR